MSTATPASPSPIAVLVVDGSDWIGLLSPTDALRRIELLNRR